MMEVRARGSLTEWSILAEGDLVLRPEGSLLKRNPKPWRVNRIALLATGHRGVVKTELHRLEVLGLNLRGTAEYETGRGDYTGRLVLEGPINGVAASRFGAPLLAREESRASRWTVDFGGGLESVWVAGTAKPGLAFVAGLPEIHTIRVTLTAALPGEPRTIQDLRILTSNGDFHGEGLYDERRRALSLAGFISLTRLAVPGSSASLNLSGRLNLDLDPSLPGLPGEITLDGGRVELGSAPSFRAFARLHWSPKDLAGEASLTNPSHSVHLAYENDIIRFDANGGSSDDSLADWLRWFADTSAEEPPPVLSLLALSEYEINGAYEIQAGRGTATATAVVSHPEADLRTVAQLAAALGKEGWRWQANSEDTSLAIPLGPTLTGGWVAEGGSRTPTSTDMLLGKPDLLLSAEWTDGVLLANLRGQETAPRLVAVAGRFFPVTLSPESRLLLNQTRLQELSVSARYEPRANTARVDGKVRGENPFLGVSLDLPEFALEVSPVGWSAGASGLLKGEGFTVAGERLRASAAGFSGALRVAATDLDLSGIRPLVIAVKPSATPPEWLAGTVSGRAEFHAASRTEGALLLEVSDWQGGPIAVTDLWLNGALSEEDLTLSGTGKIAEVPVDLAVAFTRPYEAAREGIFVVSAERLQVTDLPIAQWPDWLKGILFTGYAQAMMGEDTQRVSVSGSLSGVSPVILPSELRLDIDGDLDEIHATLQSADNSLSARATVRLAPPYPVTAQYTANRTGTLEPLISRWQGSSHGSLAADLSPFALRSFEAIVSEWRATAAGDEWHLQQPAHIRTTDGSRFFVSSLELASHTGRLSAYGEVLRDQGLKLKDARVEGVVPLAFLTSLSPDVTAVGTLSSSLKWGAEPSTFPDEGRLVLRADKFSHPSLPEPVRDVLVRARVDRDSFSVEEGTFVFSDGDGRLQGAGGFSGARLDDFAGHLTLENFRIPFSEITDSYASAFVQLSGAGNELLLAGDLKVSGGTLRLTTGSAPAPLETPVPVRLNLTVSIVDPVRVLSDNFQADMKGSLAVRGTVDTPLIFGDLALAPDGSIRVAARSFVIQSGSARFSGYSLLPEISLRAFREEPPYAIYLTATGTPPDLNAEFSSLPALTTPSILSLLATGRTLEEIQSTDPDDPSSLLSLGFQSLLSAGLEERVFDRVSTRSTTIGGKKQSVMTLGKAIGASYFAQYTFDTSSGAPEEIGFSYRLQPWELQVVQARGESPAFTMTYRGATFASVVTESATRYTLGDLQIHLQPPDRDLLKTLSEEIKRGPGDAITRAEVQRLRGLVHTALVARGYLGARASLTTSVDDDKKTISASIVAEPGNLKSIRLIAPPALPSGPIIRRLAELWATAPNDDSFVRAASRTLPAVLENEGWQLLAAETTFAGHETTTAAFTIRAHPLPVIASVRILTDQRLDIPREVRRYLRNGNPWRPIALERALKDWKQSERALGYREFFATFATETAIASIESTDRADITLTVHRGPLFRIGEVTLEPANTDRDALRRATNTALAEDRSASLTNILSLRQIIALHFREQGFSDTGIALRENPSSTGLVDLVFRVDPGPRVIVRAIVIEGPLSEFQKAQFTVLLSAFRGRPLSPSLEAGIRKVLRTSGFPTVYEIRVERGYQDRDFISATLRIRLIPASPLTYSVSAGFGSATSPILSLSGLRQGVLTPWQSLGFAGRWLRDLRNAELTFNDPRFRFREYTARLRVFAERSAHPDLVVHTRLGGVEVTRISEAARSQTTASLQVQRLTYSGGSPQSPDTAMILSLAYLRDRRDSLFHPRRGDLFSFSLRVGQNLPVRDPLFARATLHFVRGLPTSTNVSLFSRLYAGFGFHLPLGERFFYTTSLGVRGFNPDRLNPRDATGHSVGGQALALAGLEARWRIQRNWGALAFVDAGALSEKPRDFLSPHSVAALSAGAGFFYLTPLGPIRLEYQIPLKPDDGASKNELFLGFSFAY
jgi:outer membrane protein assembly factor BamA